MQLYRQSTPEQGRVTLHYRTIEFVESVFLGPWLILGAFLRACPSACTCARLPQNALVPALLRTGYGARVTKYTT